MYVELNHVNPNMAVSVKLGVDCEDGGILKVDGLADCTFGKIDLGEEALAGVNLTDEFGDMYVLIATDNHRYDERILSGDVPQHKVGDLVRGYLFEVGQRVTIEKALIDGDVEAGDVLVPKAGTTQLTKATGTEKNAVAKVLKLRKYMGRDCVKIIML